MTQLLYHRNQSPRYQHSTQGPCATAEEEEGLGLSLKSGPHFLSFNYLILKANLEARINFMSYGKATLSEGHLNCLGFHRPLSVLGGRGRGRGW